MNLETTRESRSSGKFGMWSQWRTGGRVGRRSRGYFPALDGLRAVAVAVVMLSHVGIPGFSGGKTGVLLFFALSGFLISGILLKQLDRTGRVDFKRFYGGRFLRLLPAMVLVIAATMGLALLWPQREQSQESLTAVPYVLLYVNNWAQVAGVETGWFSHFWSLAVEEQFYMLWPAILWLLHRWKGRSAVAIFALAGALGSIVLKQFVDGSNGRQAGTDFAADALLLGCALAAGLPIWGPVIARWAKIAFWPAVAVLTASMVLGNSGGGGTSEQYELFGRMWWPLAAIASTIVIAGPTSVAGAPRWVPSVLSWAPVAYIGRVSYGMYLWHILLLALINSPLNPLDGLLVRTALLFVSTVAIAALSFHFVEQPFLAMKQRFEAHADTMPPAAVDQHVGRSV